MFFDQTFKNISRVREIAGILWKYGFEDFVSNTALKSLIPEKRRLAWKKEHEKKKYSRWELTRMAAEELGPTFIKLAQVLSNRPDIVPAPLMEEFQKLQSEVPPFEFEKVREIIELETGKDLNDVFSEFRKKPIGSASIGQVHLAHLKDARKVVVKVQRPNVKTKVLTDLIIMKELVKRSESFLQSQGVYNAMDIVEAFEASMKNEMDYNVEARFMSQFRNYYKQYTNFYVPEVYKDYTSDKMLVMEFIDGCKITDVTTLKAWGLSPEEIAETGMDIYLTQIFEHGYFHADPHPGNIIIQKDGTICLIDFGMVGKLNKRDKYAFAGIMIGMGQQDVKKMARSFKRLALDSHIPDNRAFETDLSELIDNYATLDLSEVNVSEMAESLQAIIRNYRMKMPGGIFIILRALTMLEGIGKTIHPNFKTYEFFKPYGIKMLKDQYSPKNITEEIMTTFSQFSGFVQSFPVEFRDIMRKVRKGQLHIEIEPTHYEPIINKFSRAINRLALSIVIMSLFISSSILLLAYTSVQNITIYYISITGYIIAIFFTVILTISAWLSGKR